MLVIQYPYLQFGTLKPYAGFNDRFRISALTTAANQEGRNTLSRRFPVHFLHFTKSVAFNLVATEELLAIWSQRSDNGASPRQSNLRRLQLDRDFEQVTAG